MFALRRLSSVALLGLLLGACVAAGAEPKATVIPIDVAGARQNILMLTPPASPTAAVIMFPGGDGVIGISDSGAIARGGNFLIRTRAQWLAQGFVFVAVDAAPGRAGQKRDRVGPANLRAIAEIVRAVRQRTVAPIWLVGTSAGAPAAVAGAAALPPGTIEGVVISSPVSVNGPRDSVLDVALGKIAVPVLLQVHRDDRCRLSPPANAPAIKSALASAPAADLQVFAGGSSPRSSACEAFAPHGFFGIEGQVVDAAASWIRAH